MFKFISKLFPSKHEKDVKELLPVVDEINAYYEEYQRLTDEELIAKTAGFKASIKERTQELEDEIVALQEKLKKEMTHEQRQNTYAELEDKDKELHELDRQILE